MHLNHAMPWYRIWSYDVIWSSQSSQPLRDDREPCSQRKRALGSTAPRRRENQPSPGSARQLAGRRACRTSAWYSTSKTACLASRSMQKLYFKYVLNIYVLYIFLLYFLYIFLGLQVGTEPLERLALLTLNTQETSRNRALMTASCCHWSLRHLISQQEHARTKGSTPTLASSSPERFRPQPAAPATP